MTPTELTNEFISAGLDTAEKVAAFLKPAAIGAALSDLDGQIEAFKNETSAFEVERQAKLQDLVAKREEVRAKLSQ